jgi:hypothetical protein
MAMGAPILAQQLEGALGQGHIAVFVAFALPDVEHPPLAVNVGDLQVDALQQAQAARVNGRQAHAIVWATETAQDQAHLGGAEHNWQLFLARPAWQVEDDPFAVERPLIKKLEARQRNIKPTAGNLLVVLEVKKTQA